MSAVIPVPPELQGQELGFEIINDGAVTLRLDDGAEIRLKHAVTNVQKTDLKDADGNSVYLLKSFGVLTVLKAASPSLSATAEVIK